MTITGKMIEDRQRADAELIAALIKTCHEIRIREIKYLNEMTLGKEVKDNDCKGKE